MNNDLFIKCAKHGRVMAWVSQNYDAFCPFCRMEGIEKYAKGMTGEELKKLLKTSNYSMGYSVKNNKCSICDKDYDT